MPNTNFQTIHQFGAGISQVVRQATGRDPVQNIEMEHVTVAQAKRLRIVDTYTGNPLTLTANKDSYIGAEVGMRVKQNLNGQNYPWPGGCGNNMFDANSVVKNSDGTIRNCYIVFSEGTTTTPSSGRWVSSDYIPIQPGTVLYFGEDPTTATTAGTAFYDAEKVFVSGINASNLRLINQTVQVPENCYYMRHSFEVTDPLNENWETHVYITLDSNPHVYTPYENLCPITPWESVLITVNNDDRLTTFPQQVYAGIFNAWSGELQITHKCKKVSDMHWSAYTIGEIKTFVASATIDTADMEYSDSNFTIPIACSAYKNITTTPESGVPDFAIWNAGGVLNPIMIRDSRYQDTITAIWKRDMGDTQICYPLAEPIILQLRKEEIPADEGENVVSTNADTLTVTLYEAV